MLYNEILPNFNTNLRKNYNNNYTNVPTYTTYFVKSMKFLFGMEVLS